MSDETHRGRLPARRWRLWIIASVCAVSVAAVAVWRFRPDTLPEPAETEHDESTDNNSTAPFAKDTNPGYVGIEVCSDCHAERVAEFRGTRHFKACLPAAPKGMPAGFSAGNGKFITRNPALTLEMTKENGDYLCTSMLSTPEGEQRRVSRVDLRYGAEAGTDEVFFTWRDDRLFELPVVWLDPQQQWGLSAFFNVYGGGDVAREMTLKCVECHNTWFQHAPGTLNQYRPKDFLLGVTCEKCHGPGREHVEFHREHPKSTSAHAITQPAKLSRERQLDLCAECHSNALKHRKPAFSYRPGLVLSDFYKTIHPKNPEDDHVANQTRYLLESRCFQKSETLTCVTCHDPHLPREPANSSASQKSCLSCHQPLACPEQPRLPAAVRPNCVGCHMPLRNKIQVFFETQTDAFVPPAGRWEHKIAVYPEARDEVLLAWHRTQSDEPSRKEAARLTAALAQHWRGVAEQCERDFRFLAAIEACRQSLKLEPAPTMEARLERLKRNSSRINDDWFKAVDAASQNRLNDAINILEEVLKIKPDLARVHGKLGTLYAATGKKQQAVEHLRLAAKYNPDDPYAEGMLGWLAHLDGRQEEALEHYRLADDAEPRSAALQYHRGLALLSLNRTADAAQAFRDVLEIDPRHADAKRALRRLKSRGESEPAAAPVK